MEVHEARAAQAAPLWVDPQSLLERRHVWQGLARIPTVAIPKLIKSPSCAMFTETIEEAFNRIHLSLVRNAEQLTPSEASDIRLDAQRAAATLIARCKFLFCRPKIDRREYWELVRDIDLFRGVPPDAALFLFAIHTRQK